MATPIPPNDAPLALAEVVRATGGQVLCRGNGRACGVVTDSRAEVGGKLFVALPGEHFDGHAFAARAVERGAAGVLVTQDVRVAETAFVVRVPSTLNALGALARAHRQRWGGTVIAIGGSAGKTTTRGAVAAVLCALAPGAVHCARGNLNNQVGLPMVLLGVQDRHSYVVVEVGTNTRGEVAKLASICQPDLALLTLIALEHAEGLGGLDEIEAEEGALLAAVGAAGTAIVNGNDERAVRQLASCRAATKLTYGTLAGLGYRLLERSAVNLGCNELKIERPASGGRETVSLKSCLVGEPGALAVLAAIAVVDRLAPGPVLAETLSVAFTNPEVLEPGRLAPLLLADGTVVVDDTYNANPASVRSSVGAARELARSRDARLLLVLGEMRELGACSRGEHAQIGCDLAGSGAAALVAVAGDAQHMVEPARAQGMEAVFAPDVEAALSLILARLRTGDVVLVKASRGVGAERVVAGLREAKGVAA